MQLAFLATDTPAASLVEKHVQWFNDGMRKNILSSRWH
jgi:hypothetical protein